VSGPGRLVSRKFGDEICRTERSTSPYEHEHWGCQYHILLHRTHMLLHPHASAAGFGLCQFKFLNILREFEARFEPVWGQFSVLSFVLLLFFWRNLQLRLMLVFKYWVSWVSRFKFFFFFCDKQPVWVMVKGLEIRL
jgi:hypothetical protein